MKVVILAGGFGTRLSEETDVRPKPMVKIGEYPILWHIMKTYSHFGFQDFIICLGYKGEVIKEYVSNYFLYHSDITFNFRRQNEMIVHKQGTEPWTITLADTGQGTMTGGRVKRVEKYIGKQPFMLTYGDGVAHIDIRKLVKYHHSHGKIATITATRAKGRFGKLTMDAYNMVRKFEEKGDGHWINAGYMVLNPEVFDLIEGDDTVFENQPLETLARQGQLAAYPSTAFWQPMDTMRDKKYLQQLWNSGHAPWKQWEG